MSGSFVHSQRVTPSPVITINGGWFRQGSNDVELQYAIALCERTWSRFGENVCKSEIMDALLSAETPTRRIYIRPYRIDRTEVTYAAWSECTRRGFCPPSRTSPSDMRLASPLMPITGINAREAQRYCRRQGGHLPSEAQWEYAARGSDGRQFPWGGQYNDRVANHGGAIDGYRYLSPVGSFPEGRSPFGLLDMAGNAWEWTADGYDPDFYRNEVNIDPKNDRNRAQRVTRGGSWRSSPDLLRVALRRPQPELASGSDLGFRCAYDIE